MLPVHRLFARPLAAFEEGEEALAFEGGNGVAVVFGGIGSAGCVDEGGGDVDNLGGGVREVGLFDGGGPADDAGGGNAAFVDPALVAAEGGGADIGPGHVVAHVRVLGPGH